MVYPLAICCPACGAAAHSLCLTPTHAVRRSHLRRILASATVDTISALAPRVPAVERWPLAQHLITAPDHTAPPAEPAPGARLDLDSARTQLETTAHQLDQLSASVNALGMSLPGLERELKSTRRTLQALVEVLTEAAQEQRVRDLLRKGATPADLARVLLVLRAERVDTAVATTTPTPPAAAGAPVWRLDYRTSGQFWLRPEEDSPVGRVRGFAPTPAAAVRAAALFAGPGHRVVPSPPVRASRPLAEAEHHTLLDPEVVEDLLQEEEPAHAQFQAACARLRDHLIGVPDLEAWWVERAEALQACHPQSTVPLELAPDLPPGHHDHAHTCVEAIAWVPAHLIVATHCPVWGRIDSRPEVPVQILTDLVAPGNDLEGFTEELFGDEPMQLEQITGWAGPIYAVGAEGNHRTHVLRAAGLPWVAAHLIQQTPPPVVDLFLLVKDDEDQQGRGEEDRYPAERARRRRTLIDGLIDRGVIDADWDPEYPDLLWCRRLPAPWLLRSAAHATAANAVYEAAYPGALAALGIPAGVGTEAGAWRIWLTGSNGTAGQRAARALGR